MKIFNSRSFRPSQLFSILSIITILFISQSTIAQDKKTETRSAQDCYEQSDFDCLEEMFSNIITDPTEENKKAAYLLGKLKFDKSENLKDVKKQLLMTIAFTKGYEEETLKQLNKLYESGKVEFETTDCLTIENDDCFKRIIDGDDPIKKRNAQYLLGQKILKEDPKRAFQLFTSAVDAGHRSAECELAQFYVDDGLETPMDYHQSVIYGLECLGGRPFKKFNKKYFAKYEKGKQHKAYALSTSGLQIYTQGISKPDYAAALAIYFCEIYDKRKSKDAICNVINIDGRFVKQTKFTPLPDKISKVDDMIYIDAQKSFNEYSKDNSSEKVFVHSKTGASAWKGKGTGNKTLEQLKTEALKSCDRNYKKELDNRCKVVNLNGEWVDE